MRGRLREDSGLVAVIVAVFSVVMFALAALVVDLGLAREIKRDAQTAADAAVLAGVGELYTDAGALQVGEAVRAVKDTAAENFGTDETDWSNCSTSLDSGWSVSVGGESSGTSCIAFYTPADDLDGQPNEIRVVLPTKPADVLFGGLIGYEGSDIGAVAQASAVSSKVPSCTLCVFDELTTGSAEVKVTGGGSVHAGYGGDLTSGGSITVADPGTISFTGAANPPNGPKYSPNPPVTNSGVPVKDPFQSQPMPSPTDSPNSGSDNVACGPGGVPSLTPGLYRDITVKNITCTLASGLYVVTGNVRFQSAQSRMLGNGVTLYFTCGTRLSPRTCDNEEGGRFDGGRDGISLGSPYVGGFSVLYDRGNTSDLTLTAGEPNEFLGAVYARSANLVIGAGNLRVAGRVAVGSLTLSGGSTRLYVHESTSASVDGPPEILLTR